MIVFQSDADCNAMRISTADNFSLPMKFDSLRAQFGAPAPSREEAEEDIARALGVNRVEKEDISKPNWPVYTLSVTESQLYLQDLLTCIVKVHQPGGAAQ